MPPGSSGGIPPLDRRALHPQRADLQAIAATCSRKFVAAEFAARPILAKKNERGPLATVTQQVLRIVQLAAGEPAGIHNVVRPRQDGVSAARSKRTSQNSHNASQNAGESSIDQSIKRRIISSSPQPHETVHRRSLGRDRPRVASIIGLRDM